MDDPQPNSAAFPPCRERRVRPIVLVHGAWVGEWCWEPLIPLLEGSGRRVLTVSLTGHGLRAADAGPHINLDTHAGDVVAAFDTFDLTDATLVAHSYGGRVISKAWPAVADRVERIVYLDAHAPFASAVPTQVATPAEEAEPAPMIPFGGFDPDPVEFGGQASVDWFFERIVDHSPATLQQDFMVDLPAELDKTYVFATGDPASRFAPYAAAAETDTSWKYHEVPGSHWVMMSNPDRIAEIILG